LTKQQDEFEIDLDNEVIDELLSACRKAGKEEDYKGCIECRLKFMCWTHKRNHEAKKV